MAIDDVLLPAAPALTGPEAPQVVGPAVAAAGGRLLALRPAAVQYRPGHDVVVRYDATVSWGGGAPVPEVLAAATTVDGPPPGTVPVEADGLAAGVWRYPFDPFLPGLDQAVRPAGVAELLGLAPGTVPDVVVRAYRPCRRAVVEARWPGGRAFVKVVRPEQIAGLREQHERLGAAGVPVPEVRGGGDGVLVLAPLAGEALATRLLERRGPWPTADRLLALGDAIARVPASRPAATTPLATAHHHARVLRTVAPALGPRLERLCAGLGHAPSEGASSRIHGDLHEGQLTLDGDGALVGVLDVDGSGLGRREDDLAVLLAHLEVIGLAPSLGPAIARYASRLRAGFAEAVDLADLDRRTAAALVGLATGPFRTQLPGWRRRTARHLSLAEARLHRAGDRPARRAG